VLLLHCLNPPWICILLFVLSEADAKACIYRTSEGCVFSACQLLMAALVRCQLPRSCHCTDCISLSPFGRLVTPDGIPSTAKLFSPSERFRFDPIRPCAPFHHYAMTSLSPSSPHFPLFLVTSSSILDCSRVGVEGPLSLRL
jgi:hypothetical protein